MTRPIVAGAALVVAAVSIPMAGAAFVSGELWWGIGLGWIAAAGLSQAETARALIRIIARRVPWPSLKERADRSGLRLRWDVLSEDGELLVAATEYPLADGAHALASRGLDPEALVTMRHEGAEHDSFASMPLRIPAAAGAKRAEGRARLAAIHTTDREETADSGVGGRAGPANV